MSRYVLLLGVAFSIETEVFAQLPAIQTDRPDQTECPFIVPAKHLQVESGFNYEKIADEVTNLTYPTVLFRYGVNEKFEFRLIEEFVSDEVGDTKISGFTPTTIGFKAKLNEENGLAPEMAFIGHLSMPDAASEDYRLEYFAPSFRFTMQHSLSDKIALAYNAGAEWDGFSAEPTFIYTLTSGISVSSNTGFYIELYGFIPQYQQADHRFDGGVVWQPKPNLQLDLSGGIGINEIASDYFVSLGFSFRIPD